MARVFHISTHADWARARETGTYTTSTRGRTLAEEGFIHASRRDQVPGVHQSFYRDVREPLVLLTIDTNRLTEAEVREEDVDGTTYPHIYGPLNAGAVIDVQPMNRHGGTDSFLMVFIKEMAKRMAIATAVMVLVTALLLLAVWLRG